MIEKIEQNRNKEMEGMQKMRIRCWKDIEIKSKAMGDPPQSVKIVYEKKTQRKVYSKSDIRFYNMDTIDCAIKFKELNPLTLNLSDDIYAGGYVSSGSGAQEESLFRRTNYCRTLLQSFYPIVNNEAVYSPDISVIKTSEATKWETIAEDKVHK